MWHQQHHSAPFSTMQHPASPCSTLQHHAAPCKTLYHLVGVSARQLQETAAACSGHRTGPSYEPANIHGFIMHCTALYCTVLNFTALHCTVLYYTSLNYTTMNYTSFHCTAMYLAVLHHTALYCTVLNCNLCTALFCLPQPFNIHGSIPAPCRGAGITYGPALQYTTAPFRRVQYTLNLTKNT